MLYGIGELLLQFQKITRLQWHWLLPLVWLASVAENIGRFGNPTKFRFITIPDYPTYSIYSIVAILVWEHHSNPKCMHLPMPNRHYLKKHGHHRGIGLMIIKLTKSGRQISHPVAVAQTGSTNTPNKIPMSGQHWNVTTSHNLKKSTMASSNARNHIANRHQNSEMFLINFKPSAHKKTAPYWLAHLFKHPNPTMEVTLFSPTEHRLFIKNNNLCHLAKRCLLDTYYPNLFQRIYC